MSNVNINGNTKLETLYEEKGIAANKTNLPVAIIGGGPVGLAAAAQLTQRGEKFILFEAGTDIANNVRTWQHVRIFSPWRYNLDKATTILLKATGWQAPNPEVLPTGAELIEQYLRPLANLPVLQPSITLNAKVISVGRKGLDKMVTNGRDDLPFVLGVNVGGQIKRFEAKAIIDASGTWANPNPIGSGGVAAQGEIETKDQIFYGVPNVLGGHKTRYAGKKVLVVGGGHSAVNSLIDLVKLKRSFPDTDIIWALRKKQMRHVYGGEAADALPARGALGSRIRAEVEAGRLEVVTPFYIYKIGQADGKLRVSGSLGGEEHTLSGIDEIIAVTGSRPDLAFMREVRVTVDPALECVADLAPLIDPNIHSCGTVRPHGEKELRQPEKDFYVVGSKSYGRAPTFLMATGYEQIRSVVAGLVFDREAANRVELDLPETGVCSTDLSAEEESLAALPCCSPVRPIEVEHSAIPTTPTCCG